MGGHEEEYLQPAALAPVAAGRQQTLPVVLADPGRHQRRNPQSPKVSKTIVEEDRSYRGFNFFDDDDQKLFRTIARGEFNISGFQNKNLSRHLPEWDTAKVCRILKTLRVHGLIKKIGLTYKCYLTYLGRQVVTAGLKLKTLTLVPELSATPLHCKS